MENMAGYRDLLECSDVLERQQWNMSAANEFSRLMQERRSPSLLKCEAFTQSDGTIRVITMVPYLLFVNWYVLLPCTGFVVD